MEWVCEICLEVKSKIYLVIIIFLSVGTLIKTTTLLQFEESFPHLVDLYSLRFCKIAI